MTPSGKLATHVPGEVRGRAVVGELPRQDDSRPRSRGAGEPHVDGDREAEVEYLDDIWVGYRHYATKGVKVAYPFGFGLSYTTFAYSDLKLSGAEFGTGLTATVTVKNTGKAPGREVVQLYLSAPGKSMPKPAIELRGFAKTKVLAPGESQTLTFTIAPRDLAVVRRGYVVVGGRGRHLHRQDRRVVGGHPADGHVHEGAGGEGRRRGGSRRGGTVSSQPGAVRCTAGGAGASQPEDGLCLGRVCFSWRR